MSMGPSIVLAVVRVQYWRRLRRASRPHDDRLGKASIPSEAEEGEKASDEVEMLLGDHAALHVTEADVLQCARMLTTAVGKAGDVAQRHARNQMEIEAEYLDPDADLDADAEQDVWTRRSGGLMGRVPLSTASSGDASAVLFEFPKTHALYGDVRGVAVADALYRRVFAAHIEFRWFMCVTNVPFLGFCQDRLEAVACQVFAETLAMERETAATHMNVTVKNARGNAGVLLYQELTARVRFAEFSYSALHAALPIESLVRRLGKEVVTVLRVLLLEGRVVCFAASTSTAAAATMGLMALLPGALVTRAKFSNLQLTSVLQELKHFGLPFSLTDEMFAYQPCFTNDQATTVYGTRSFLVGTSDPLLLKHSDANLDVIVDLEFPRVVILPTPTTDAAAECGKETEALSERIELRVGREIVVGESPDSTPHFTLGGNAIADTEESPISEADWIVNQFRAYFEQMLSDMHESLKKTPASSPIKSLRKAASSTVLFTRRLASKANSFRSSRRSSVTQPTDVLAATYGAAWIETWQNTAVFENWKNAQRFDRLNGTGVKRRFPPSSGEGSFVYSNGDKYEGEFSGGKRHGFGTYTEFMTKNRYEGEWRRDKRHGKGLLVSKANGYIYDGMWRRDMRCGQGHSTLKDVESYTGEWLNNCFHGMGLHSNADGDVYDGEWQHGLKDGVGKLTIAVPRSDGEFGGLQQYVGEWNKNQYNGTGAATYADGTQFSGDFQDGKRHGHGVLVYANKDRYDGQWWKGFRHGEGSLFVKASGMTKEGKWNRDVDVDGMWLLYYANGDKYTGECRRGRPCGEGICKYADGSSFSGTWMDGLRDGNGVFVNADGNILEGEWRHDVFIKSCSSRFVDVPLSKSAESFPAVVSPSKRRRRKSTLSYPNGDNYQGELSDGKRHGFGVFTEHLTGSVYEGDWRNDRRNGHGVWTSGLKDFIYDGMWSNDMRQGYGHCVIRGCESYSGEWHANQFHGTGKFVDAEGNVYDGEFAWGKKHGAGKQISASQKEQYVGEWKDGYRDGMGNATFADGSTYSGQWSNDLQNGEGTFVAANGERYIGQWRQGLRDGAGTLFSPLTGSTKEGLWHANVAIDGEWTIGFADGSKFTGQCVQGRPHGHGVCKYANGDLYDGEWVQGKRHGMGTGFFANGESFEGEWENNHVALRGCGKLTLVDGTVHVYE